MKTMLRSIVAIFLCFSAAPSFACILSPEQEDNAFAKADGDGNKRLSPEEYFTSYAHPLPNDMWDKIFATLDKNRDGVLTRREYDAKAGEGYATDGGLVKRPHTKSAEQPESSTGCVRLK